MRCVLKDHVVIREHLQNLPVGRGCGNVRLPAVRETSTFAAHNDRIVLQNEDRRVSGRIGVLDNVQMRNQAGGLGHAILVLRMQTPQRR